MGEAELVAELRRLCKGRGLLSQDLLTRLGPRLTERALASGIGAGDLRRRAPVREWLIARLPLLPDDLEFIARVALGVHPDAGGRFLNDRVQRLAEMLDRDVRTVRRRIDECFDLLAEYLQDEIAVPQARPVHLGEETMPGLTPPVTAHTVTGPVTIHTCQADLLGEIDIVVAPHNVYFDLPQIFKSSVAATLRRAALTRDGSGELAVDVMADELSRWKTAHGRRGLPAALGTVVPGDPGELRTRGLRRIYHAAVTMPRIGIDGYDVPLEAIGLAVRNVFRMARTERDRFDPPLASLCFPLLGAGRGGLDPLLSATLLWSAVSRELADDARWTVHLVTRRPEHRRMLLGLLQHDGPGPSGAMPDTPTGTG